MSTKSIFASAGSASSAGALALAILAFPGVAHAQDSEGPYVRIDAGYGLAGNVDIETTAVIGVNADVDEGYLVSGAVGYASSSGFRIEGEVAQRWSTLKPSTTLDRNGKLNATTLMLNGFYELGGSDSIVRPYVGGGAGVAFTKLTAKNSVPLLPVSITDKSTSFAYQAMAGIAVDVTKDVTLDLGYRYFVASSLKGSALSPPAVPKDFSADFKQHTVTVGIRVGF